MKNSFQSIIDNIKRGIYAPVYFLQGPEAYYIDTIVNHIKDNALTKQTRGLNFRTYYGKEQNIQAIISHARCLPMLGNRQVIIVKEAQGMTDLQRVQGQKLLIHYLKQPNLKTIVVFAYKYKTLTNKNLLQAFTEGSHILFKTPRMSENKIPAWIKDYVNRQGYNITPQAIAILQSLLGMNLEILANELQKIMINLEKGKIINENLVSDYVGVQRFFNPFELQRMIGFKKKDKTIHVLNYLLQNQKQHPPMLVISLLTTFFFKLLQLHYLQSRDVQSQAKQLEIHPYFIKDYQMAIKQHTISAIKRHLKALHRADLQLKGISSLTKNSQILKELVVRLLQ